MRTPTSSRRRSNGYNDGGGNGHRPCRGRSMTAGVRCNIRRVDEDCHHRYHHRRRRSSGCTTTTTVSSPAMTTKRRAVSLGDNGRRRSGSSCSSGVTRGAHHQTTKNSPSSADALNRQQQMKQQDKAARTAAAVNTKASGNRTTAKVIAVHEELRNSRRGRSITSRRSSPPPPPVGTTSFRARWHRSRSSFSNNKKKKDGIVWNEIEHPTKGGVDTKFLRTWAIRNSRSRSSSTKKKENDGAPSKETKLSRSSTSSISNNRRRRRRETTSLKPKHYRQLIVNKLLNSNKPLLLGKEERGDRLLSQRRRNKSVPARLGHKVTWWNNSTSNKEEEEKDSSTSDGSSTSEECSSQSSETRRKTRGRSISSNPRVTKSPSGRQTPNSSVTQRRTPNRSVTPLRRGGRPLSRLDLRVAVTPIAGKEEEEMRYQAQHRRLPYTSDEILSRRSRRRSTVDEGRMPPVPFLHNKQQHKQYHRGSDIECSRRRQSMSMPLAYTPRLPQTQQRPPQRQQQHESTGPVIYCDRTSMVSSLASMDSSWIYQRTNAHRDTIKLIETEIEKRLTASKNRRSKFDLKHQQPPQPLRLLDPVVITCDDNKTNNDPISQMASIDSSWIHQCEKYKRRCRHNMDKKRDQILQDFVSTIEKTTNSKTNNNNKQLQLRRRTSSCQPKLLTNGSSIPLYPRLDSIYDRSKVAVRQEEGTSLHNSNEVTPRKKSKHEFDISHMLNKVERKINGTTTTSTVPSNMDISGSDVKTRTTTSRTGSSWDVRVPNPISSLPGSSYERQVTHSTTATPHSVSVEDIVIVEEEEQGKTTTSSLMVSASDMGSSSWGGVYEPKPSTGCSNSVQSPCESNALTLFGDNGPLRGPSKDGSSKDTLGSPSARVSIEVTDTPSSSDSSSNVSIVRFSFPQNKIISSVVENDHDATPIMNNSAPHLTNKKFVVPPLHSEIRSKMPKHLSSYYEKEKKKKKKAQHMNSLNESEISGLTLPVALRCPPKPPPQNLLKYASLSSSDHKESKDENINVSTAGSADESAGSKVGRDIDINTNYTSQLSELSSPTTVPPMLVEALVERYRHLSSHTKKKRLSHPLPTMREQMSKMTMDMPSSPHSHLSQDHVHSMSSESSSCREVRKDSTSHPTRDHASSNRSSKVLPTPS